jgi:hypothetical protein
MQTQAQERAMTKILLMSDVHIEFGELSVPKTQADVVVLAGDIHVGVAAAAWSDSLAKRLGIPVVHVPGNHEHYGSMRQPGHHMGGTVAELRAAAAATAGRVTFLERETAIVAGVRFVGCTLWTDYELFGDPAEDMAHAEIAMTDYETIAYRPGVRFTTNDARGRGGRNRAGMIHAGGGLSESRAGAAVRRSDGRDHPSSAVPQISAGAPQGQQAERGVRFPPR